jgi:Na+/H+-dicarboxylate symporter
MYVSTVVSVFLAIFVVNAQQPGGQINSPEALASPGTGKYGSVRKPQSAFDVMHSTDIS